MFDWLKRRLIKAYTGVSQGPRLSDWTTSSLDAVQENNSNVVGQLASKARDLRRNNEHAEIGVDLVVSKLISDQGINPKFKVPENTVVSESDIKRMRQLKRIPSSVKEILSRKKLKPARKYELAVQKLWSEWSAGCDYSGEKTYNGIVKIAVGAMVTDGECLIRRVIVNDSAIPMKIQLIEADQISDRHENSKDILQGIRIDEVTRKPKSILLLNSHPGGVSFDNDFTEFSMNNIIHMKEDLRPGQLRGVTWLASVIVTIRELGKSQNNELSRQAVSSCLAVIISGGDKTETPGLADTKTTGISSGKIEPATFYHTKAGETVTQVSPPPNLGFSDFSKITLEKVASGLRLGYSELTGDYSSVNFSSGRLSENRSFKLLKPLRDTILAEGTAKKIASWFLDAIYLIGVPRITIEIEIPPMIPVTVDPLMQITVVEKKLENGLISWREAVRAEGRDPEILRQEILEDNQFFKANDIKLSFLGEDPQEEADDASKKYVQDHIDKNYKPDE